MLFLRGQEKIRLTFDLFKGILLDIFTICQYNCFMNFEWDKEKNSFNIQKHGLDFGIAPEVFDGPMLVNLDSRQNYKEDRWIGIGTARGRVVVVVFTERDKGETIRIISLRKALKHERKKFEEKIRQECKKGKKIRYIRLLGPD